MPIFTINITQEHIDKAKELLAVSSINYCGKCPNGLAIREIPELKNCWAGPQYLGTGAAVLINFPPQIIRFMYDFDMHKKVVPLSYTLTITDEQFEDIINYEKENSNDYSRT